MRAGWLQAPKDETRPLLVPSTYVSFRETSAASTGDPRSCSLTQHKMSLLIEHLRVPAPLLWAGIPGPSLHQPRAPKVSWRSAPIQAGGREEGVWVALMGPHRSDEHQRMSEKTKCSPDIRWDVIQQRKGMRLLTRAPTRKHLENTVRERSHTQKAMYCAPPLLWNE